MKPFYKEAGLVIPFAFIFLFFASMVYFSISNYYSTSKVVTMILKENKLSACQKVCKIEFEDHTYVYLVNSWNSAGNSFLHDPGCVCMKENQR